MRTSVNLIVPRPIGILTIGLLFLPFLLWADWVFKAPLQVPRAGLVCEAVNNKIYAIGGRMINDVLTGICEEYDPIQDRWVFKQPMPTPRYSAVSGVVGNKIFVIGGDTNTNIYEPKPTGVIEVYDPLRDTWETVNSSWQNPRSGAAGAVIGDWIYILGGEYRGQHPMATDTVEAYNPIQNRWVIKRSMFTPRAYFDAVSYGDKVFAIGGRMGGPLRTCEVFDTITNTWDSIRSLPRSRAYFASAVLANKIFVIGGLEGQQGFLSKRVEIYQDSCWCRFDSLNQARYRLGAAVIGNDIYAIGGKDNLGNYYGTVEQNTFLGISETPDSTVENQIELDFSGPTVFSSNERFRFERNWKLFDATGEKINPTNLKPGIYFLIIKKGEKAKVKKVICL